MPGFEKVRKNLEAHGFDVTCFDTAAEAADYLDRRLDGKTVGHGGALPPHGVVGHMAPGARRGSPATGWGTASQTQPPPRSI